MQVILGMLIIGQVVLGVGGMIAGIIGLADRRHEKGIAIAGLIISSSALIWLISFYGPIMIRR